MLGCLSDAEDELLLGFEKFIVSVQPAHAEIEFTEDRLGLGDECLVQEELLLHRVLHLTRADEQFAAEGSRTLPERNLAFDRCKDGTDRTCQQLIQRRLCQLGVEIKSKQIVDVDTAIVQDLKGGCFVLAYKRRVVGMDVLKLVVLQLDVALVAVFSNQLVHILGQLGQ